ncbi:MAG: hypothetical protein OFPI_30090 [Osedax symbiont Rs2]|nr:MAG: hypothetical protein OFPI_30090 [Osedax symbiont Rs2]
MSLIDKRYTLEKRWLEIGQLRCRFFIYESNSVKNNRRMLMLHGAGVAAQDTWSNIISMLEGWQSIVVPDLRGMGESVEKSGSESAFTIEQLVADLQCLCAELNWSTFDLAGYSLGGLVSLLYKQQYPHQVGQQFVLEPGLLDRQLWQDSQALRELYADVVQQLRSKDARAGVENFLDTISPNRKSTPSAHELAIQRLMQRHLGFANALECVNLAANNIDRQQLVAAQGKVVSIIGALSVPSMHHYHQQLATQQHNWQYYSVAGTDHSLPYQKPRQIARIFNAVAATQSS